MKALRTYSMLVTFGLTMIISGQLIWNLCPAMDIINITAWSIFIGVAASMIFVVVTEPKPKRRAVGKRTGRGSTFWFRRTENTE